MKAMVLREHGGLDKLLLETNFPDPVIGPKDVLVRVRATSLNYHDVFTLKGMPGIKVPMPAIIGLDVAGDIVEVGAEVQGWKAGQRVLVDPINREEGGLIGETMHGGAAELCRVPSSQLIALPDEVSYVDAAALPCAYGTAYRMMVTIGKVKAGERVLILGASGGVGVCCVQLAKLAGAEVVAAAGSEEKAARLKNLGADHTINYRDKDFMKEIYTMFGKPSAYGPPNRKGVDVVVNFTGGDTWVKSLRCLQRQGRMLTCGATAGYSPEEDLRFIWTYELAIFGSNGWVRDDVIALLELLKAGKLKSQVDEVLPLEQLPEALRRIENREVFGKLVVTP